MVIETKDKEQVRGKSVLLFSGGADSIIFNYLLKPDIILHIDYGGKYCEIEKQKIKELIKCGAIDKNKLIQVDFGDWLGKLERDDLIIPSRNDYFITYAANFGEVIYLCSVLGDRSTDKDKTFYRLKENVLNHVYQKQHWCEGRTFKVVSPYKHLTKTELVRLYLKEGGNSEWLKISYSCYGGKKLVCNECKVCFRKAVSLWCNRVDINKYYNVKKLKNLKGILKLKSKIIKGEYRGKEDKDICKFMEWKYNEE